MDLPNDELIRILGFPLNESQSQGLDIYNNLLQHWNTKFNLTAIRDPRDIVVKHFLDSITCFQVMKNLSNKRVIDVGTGPGFPGLVLKIIQPEIHLTLVEAVQKKATFCQRVVDQIGLQNVLVIHERAETLGQDKTYREKYDWAVARAVANMSTLAEYLLPLIKPDGFMLAQKGKGAPEETATANNAIKILGGNLHSITPVSLPGIEGQRYLVVIKKITSTPNIYPRRPGTPAKIPL